MNATIVATGTVVDLTPYVPCHITNNHDDRADPVTSVRVSYRDGTPSAVRFTTAADDFYFISPEDLPAVHAWPQWLRPFATWPAASPTLTVMSVRTLVTLKLTNGPEVTDLFEVTSPLTDVTLEYTDGVATGVLGMDAADNPYFTKPDGFDEPANWPQWMRDLAAQHRPAA